MNIIENALTYVENRGIVRQNISFDNLIRDIGSDNYEGDTICLPYDAIVLPGFIDLHIHGAGGADIRDESTYESVKIIADTLVNEGTTSFLATEAVQDHDKMLSTLYALKLYQNEHRENGARVIGVHLEGPFVEPSYAGGLLQDAICLPDIELFKQFAEASGNTIKIVTLAPELEKAAELIQYISGHGIVTSIGHTDATYLQIERAIKAGATNVTHVYNAQRALHHREIGVVGSALLLDKLACELIADTIHVSIPAMKLLVKCKPKDKIILITDSICFKGKAGDGVFNADGQNVSVINGAPRLQNGKLAGSTLCMNRAIENMVNLVGVTLEQAVDCATINPAKALHIEEQAGSIRAGKYADLTIINSRFQVLYTIRDGKIVYRAL